MSLQQYDSFLKEHKLSTNREQTEMVKRVGARIQNAVERYFTANGMGSRLADYKWDFNLVEDKQVNARCKRRYGVKSLLLHMWGRSAGELPGLRE